MSSRARIALAALIALTLAGCGTMGNGGKPDGASTSGGPAFGKSKANSEALIGGALIGSTPVDSAPDTAQERILLEQWKRDRQFF